MSEKVINAKIEIVKDIAKMIEEAKSVILVDYRGLNVEEATNLRTEFRNNGVTYKVLKNSMVVRALAQLGIEGLDDQLKGPSGFAFGNEDPVAPAKIIKDFIDKKKKMSIKAGIIDGRVIDENGVKALASLPSREVLAAKMLGSMNSPVTGLVSVMSGTIRSLLYTLNAIQEQK